MKIKVLEERVEYVDSEIDVVFPYYYSIDLTDFDDELTDDTRHLYGRLTEDGKIIEIVESYINDDSEMYSIRSEYVDFTNDLTETKVNDILIGDYSSTEEEFDDVRQRYLDYIEEHFDVFIDLKADDDLIFLGEK